MKNSSVRITVLMSYLFALVMQIIRPLFPTRSALFPLLSELMKKRDTATFQQLSMDISHKTPNTSTLTYLTERCLSMPPSIPKSIRTSLSEFPATP